MSTLPPELKVQAPGGKKQYSTSVPEDVAITVAVCELEATRVSMLATATATY